MDRKRGLSDEEVEKEIERLNRSDAVRIAREEQRRKYRRRQYLYTLRDLERKGKELMAAGITEDMIDGMYEEE